MSWEELNECLDHLIGCKVKKCKKCKLASSRVLEITQENQKEEVKQMVQTRLLELDQKLTRALGQYKIVMAGYRYGQIHELLKLYREFFDKQFEKQLQMWVKLKAFCNLTRKSVAYTLTGEYETLDGHIMEGD